MMTPFLYYTKMLRWVFIGPAHWNNSPQIQRRRYTHENKFIIFGVILLGIATLCYKVCQWLATGRWFSPGTPVPSTNKTDRLDRTEILLKVALSTITPVIMFNFDFLYIKNTYTTSV
jgi:hypothetical protein